MALQPASRPPHNSSTMPVHIPLYQRVRALGTPFPEAPPSPDRKPKILIADDEAVIADTLALILNQSGFVAAAVPNGQAAVRLAADWSPDILLTDLVMPRLNGFEAAKRICARHPRCRVFLLSAQLPARELLEDPCAEFYGFQFLAKPIHPSLLLGRLRASLQPVHPLTLVPWYGPRAS